MNEVSVEDFIKEKKNNLYRFLTEETKQGRSKQTDLAVLRDCASSSFIHQYKKNVYPKVEADIDKAIEWFCKKYNLNVKDVEPQHIGKVKRYLLCFNDIIGKYS